MENHPKNEGGSQNPPSNERIYAVPMSIAAIVFLIAGALFNAWHPAWVVFPVTAISTHVISSIKRSSFGHYGTMSLAAIVFLLLGFVFDAWHPAWVVFPVTALLAYIREVLKT